jgi:hypothetical protein
MVPPMEVQGKVSPKESARIRFKFALQQVFEEHGQEI